jgi:hypothetical protein
MINSDTISTTDSHKGKAPATKPPVEEIKAGLKPADQSGSSVNQPEQGSEANAPDRESSLTRRALLVKTGWAVPVILAVGLPSTVLAGMTSPSGHHDHKPIRHDSWSKKKHSPHSDKKKHWPNTDNKKHSFDNDKKKHWPDTDNKKHSFDNDKKKQWPDPDNKKHSFDPDKKKQWPDPDNKKAWFDTDNKKHHYYDRLWF